MLLGLQQTYVDAQRIVTALERAKADPAYFDSAVEILGAYVGDERQLVANKAIALGADPAMIAHLLAGMNTTGEVIEVVSSGPVVRRRRIPWWAIGASALGLVGAFFAYKKYRAGRALF